MTESEKRATHRSRRTGVVTARSGDQTIRVEVSNLVKDSKYGKYVRRRSRLATHDPDNKAKLGDKVEIASCRRISKHKSWRLVRVIRSSEAMAEALSAENR